MEFFRTTPLTEQKFTDVWPDGLARSAAVSASTRPVAQVVEALSAHHEYEYRKLKLAVANKEYTVQKHKNDLFDSEQLIYLEEPALHFLTVDKGYLQKITDSNQRTRIHQVPAELCGDPRGLETLLRKITASNQ